MDWTNTKGRYREEKETDRDIARWVLGVAIVFALVGLAAFISSLISINTGL